MIVLIVHPMSPKDMLGLSWKDTWEFFIHDYRMPWGFSGVPVGSPWSAKGILWVYICIFFHS